MNKDAKLDIKRKLVCHESSKEINHNQKCSLTHLCKYSSNRHIKTNSKELSNDETNDIEIYSQRTYKIQLLENLGKICKNLNIPKDIPLGYPRQTLTKNFRYHKKKKYPPSKSLPPNILTRRKESISNLSIGECTHTENDNSKVANKSKFHHNKSLKIFKRYMQEKVKLINNINKNESFTKLASTIHNPYNNLINIE